MTGKIEKRFSLLRYAEMRKQVNKFMSKIPTLSANIHICYADSAKVRHTMHIFPVLINTLRKNHRWK